MCNLFGPINYNNNILCFLGVNFILKNLACVNKMTNMLFRFVKSRNGQAFTFINSILPKCLCLCQRNTHLTFFTAVNRIFSKTYMCWPVLYPQMTGGAVLPGDVVVKVSYRQSPTMMLKICVHFKWFCYWLFSSMFNHSIQLISSSIRPFYRGMKRNHKKPWINSCACGRGRRSSLLAPQSSAHRITPHSRSMSKSKRKHE